MLRNSVGSTSVTSPIFKCSAQINILSSLVPELIAPHPSFDQNPSAARQLPSNIHMSHITINNRTIGPGHPIYIIAEMSANHNQDFDQAVKIIEAPMPRVRTRLSYKRIRPTR